VVVGSYFGANAVFADGSVHFLKAGMDVRIMARLITRAGGEVLRAKVCRYRPQWLAVVGIGAFRVAFDAPKAVMGRQELVLGDTGVWVLPNPSGLNAHYTVDTLAEAFADLREAVRIQQHRNQTVAGR